MALNGWLAGTDGVSEGDMFAAAEAAVMAKKARAAEQQRATTKRKAEMLRQLSAREKAQRCAAKGCDVRVSIDGQMYVHEHKCGK